MFSVSFVNNTKLNEQQCKWNLLPKIPIIDVHLQITQNKQVKLSGFELYLYFAEKYTFIHGAKGTIVDTLNIFGKIKDEVYQFSYSVRYNKVFQKKNQWGLEFTPLVFDPITKKLELRKPRKTNHNLWIPGIVTSKQECKIIRNV